ncbi:MAG: AmmeMemoRadiSam system protein B, partial [Myxococcales bacterium]
MRPQLVPLLLLCALSGCTCNALPGRRALRPAELAGDWYPDKPAKLSEALERAMQGAAASEQVRAIVVPHAGLQYTSAIAGPAWGAVRGQRFERVVILAQTHPRRFDGVALAAEGGYQTPLGPVLVDEDATALLATHPGFARRAAPFDGENSVELVLFWMAHLWPQARVVPVLLGRVDEDALAGIADAVRTVLDERTLLVTSSDMAHVGPGFGNPLITPGTPRAQAARQLRTLQQPAVDALTARDEEALLEKTRAGGLGICSLDALRVLLRLVGPERSARLVATGSSADVDWDPNDPGAVGYASLLFPGRWPAVPEPTAAEREALAAIARDGLRHGGNPPLPANLPPRVTQPGGAFVTVTVDGQLRACMGKLLDETLGHAVRNAAQLAATADARHGPLSVEELQRAKVEITLVGPLSPLEAPEQLEPGRHGVYLHYCTSSAVLLPQVARERGYDREAFLRAAAEKAGLPPDGWKNAELERFGATSFDVPDRAAG